MTEQLNRLNDFYFKYLMGNPKNKAIALDFINAALATETSYYTDIIYVNKDEDPEHEGDKQSRLDVKARLNDGSLIDLEMQALADNSMSERSLYYWSRMYSGMLKSGDDYSSLKPAISVIVLGFEHFKDEELWHNEYQVLNVRSHKLLSKDLRIIFLELPKLNEKIDVNSMLEVWGAYFGRKLDDANLREVGNMASVLQAELEFTADEKLRYKYEQREMFLHDQRSRENQAEARGLKEGEAKGELKKSLEIAHNMKIEGDSVEKIMRVTGLTAEQIA